MRELPNDCSPSWVRNRGQYVCQLIHDNITPYGVMSCKIFVGHFFEVWRKEGEKEL